MYTSHFLYSIISVVALVFSVLGRQKCWLVTVIRRGPLFSDIMVHCILESKRTISILPGIKWREAHCIRRAETEQDEGEISLLKKSDDTGLEISNIRASGHFIQYEMEGDQEELWGKENMPGSRRSVAQCKTGFFLGWNMAARRVSCWDEWK